MLSAGRDSAAADAERGSERHTSKIRDLNDAFRQNLPHTGKGYRFNVTSGVATLGPERLAQLINSVRTFANFSEDNDPHGEHDFGAIAQEGVRYFWKIDAYDRSMDFGSPDPGDPAVTTRVMTLMRADEY